MGTRTRRVSVLVGLLGLLSAATASAQVFGTFSWQMQPYCNVVTLTLTQFPAGFTLDGSDNQCGAATLAGATGQASINPDGSVGINFAIVTAPAGRAVHVAAVISPANGSGTWTDSLGNTGTFVLAGNTPGLAPRPLPASGLAAGVITSTELAAGSVGAAKINPAEVQARVSGACPAGQMMSGINADGSVSCASGDQAGSLARATFDGIALPASIGVLAQVSTITFQAAKTGTALLRSRGFCAVETSTTTPVNVVLKIVPDGGLFIGPITQDLGIAAFPPEASATVRFGTFSAEATLAVVAGSSYTMDLIAGHLNGDASNASQCFGSLTAVVH